MYGFQWNSNPLLLFSDPIMVEALPVEHFRQQASHMTHQQHLQMGLRKGMAILIYYVVGNTHYQAVLIAEESVMNRGGRGENRLWKRVTPSVTEFAFPPNIAESFCKNALYRATDRTYCAFDTPHLGLDTENFVADVFVENILYLGILRCTEAPHVCPGRSTSEDHLTGDDSGLQFWGRKESQLCRHFVWLCVQTAVVLVHYSSVHVT